MAITDEKAKELAEGIIRYILSDVEYSYVYENDDVVEETQEDEDFEKIHGLIHSAKVKIEF